ncbi:hypothetical protein [Empedobacter falsenii]|uniref:Uncharacterized protein n=1 Tax=Empedobacter falsenii TaxID=343874 RepID=A0A3R8URU9_9FLAO|nr:hypothetical protein [Empedobacter falsenii]RRT94151.1 hypothetical protein EGI89_01950 [Empedobacter falsenii]RRT94345.1 hypothetical protein EGI88_01955 [Empedobacter falsenii]
MKTYDIHFNDSENSNNKGFSITLDEAKNYIKEYNGTNESYFQDYKGGIVSVVDNETGEVFYEEEIPKYNYQDGGKIVNEIIEKINNLTPNEKVLELLEYYINNSILPNSTNEYFERNKDEVLKKIGIK